MNPEDDPLVKKFMESLKISISPDYEYNKFMRSLGEFMAEAKVTISNELDPKATIVVVRAEGWDPTKDIWRLEGNKSLVRPDLRCSTCNHVLVMSNDMYSKYKAAEQKPKVLCEVCFHEHLNTLEKSDGRLAAGSDPSEGHAVSPDAGVSGDPS